MNDNQIKGLLTVKKNQLGYIKIGEELPDFLLFLCPICNDMEEVSLRCAETTDALEVIGMDSVVQLICPCCEWEIYDANYIIDHPTCSDLQERRDIYKELGWMD